LNPGSPTASINPRLLVLTASVERQNASALSEAGSGFSQISLICWQVNRGSNLVSMIAHAPADSSKPNPSEFSLQFEPILYSGTDLQTSAVFVLFHTLDLAILRN
jgi:hypothetical protein